MISIINQIQASVTSEAINNLGEYEENTTENQKYTNIQDRTQPPPKPSYKDGKHQFPLSINPDNLGVLDSLIRSPPLTKVVSRN
jgi:hypothetical protein